MHTSILQILFVAVLLLNSLSFAEEGDTEPLMVPETQEAPSQMEEPIGEVNPEERAMLEEAQEQTPEQTNTPEEMIENHNPHEEVTSEQDMLNNEAPRAEESNPSAMNEAETSDKPQPNTSTPSLEDLEVRHAEEAELREVGAGEELTE